MTHEDLLIDIGLPVAGVLILGGCVAAAVLAANARRNAHSGHPAGSNDAHPPSGGDDKKKGHDDAKAHGHGSHFDFWGWIKIAIVVLVFIGVAGVAFWFAIGLMKNAETLSVHVPIHPVVREAVTTAKPALALPSDDQPECPAVYDTSDKLYCTANKAGPKPIEVHLSKGMSLCIDGEPWEHGVSFVITDSAGGIHHGVSDYVEEISSFAWTSDHDRTTVIYYPWPDKSCGHDSP
jgi:hypothetical protein